MRRTVAAGLAGLLGALTGVLVPSRVQPAALSAPPGSCPATIPIGRILVIGDSISQWGAWQAQLAGRLDAACADYTIYNASIGGYGTNQAINSIPLLLTAVKPDLVIYGMEINDDPAGFRDRYAKAMDLLRQWGGPTVRIIPAFAQHQQIPPAPSWVDTRVKDDEVYSVTFVDGRFAPNIVGYAAFNQIPANTTYQDTDGIHPTAAGLVKMGDQAYRGMYRWGAYPLPALPADPDLCLSACP